MGRGGESRSIGSSIGAECPSWALGEYQSWDRGQGEGNFWFAKNFWFFANLPKLQERETQHQQLTENRA